MNLSSYPHLVKEWWLCHKGHSNKSKIQSRTEKNKPRGCPYCSGRKTLNYDLFK